MRRDWGFKLGAILFVISFLYLSQTSFKTLIPAIALETYIDGFEMPSIIGGLDLVLIFWVTMILGIVFFVLAALDLPPFNY